MNGNTFSVEIKNLDKLTAAFEKAPDIVEPVMQKAVILAGAILAENTVPGNIPWVTGTLARSFNPITIGRLFARWYPKVNYAKSVQFGQPPHVILPKNKKALFWKGAAHPVKKVNHPGSKGRHYMERILKASEFDINLVFKDALKMVVTAIKNG